MVARNVQHLAATRIERTEEAMITTSEAMHQCVWGDKITLVTPPIWREK